MTPKFQFRISDLICVALIVGALPTLAAPELPQHRLLIFIMGAALEFPAAVWAIGVLRAWEIKSFFTCLAVHFYAFVAGLNLLIFPVVVIVMFFLLNPRNDLGIDKLVVLLWFIVSGAGAASVLLVEKNKRARLKKDNESRVP